jgi:hypothetical protein
MYRFLLALSAVALLVGTLAAAPDLTFDGEIVSSSSEKLVILAGAQQQEFVLSAATKITLNGKEAPATELMAGQTAKVSAERKDGELRAATVTAFSPK